MGSRLVTVTATEWETLARAAAYRVSILAKKVNVSRQHLGRYFHQHFKLPPKVWLARLMLRDAHSHLCNGEPIKGFYDALGFRHPSDFARAFRRLTRRRPTAARNDVAPSISQGAYPAFQHVPKGCKMFQKAARKSLSWARRRSKVRPHVP